MTSTYQDVRQWIVAFESRARALLAAHGRGRGRDGYRIKAEKCSKHGDACVWVLYGVLVEHVTWAEEDPCLLAARLVDTMLPKQP